MNTDSGGKNLLAAVKGLLVRIKKLEKDLAVRRSLYLEIDYEEAISQLDMLFGLVRELGTMPLGLLPLVHLEEVAEFLVEVEEDLTEMYGFVPSRRTDPQETWNEIVLRLKGSITERYVKISPYFLALKED